jgi:YD repeat-containing protein
MSQTTTAPGYSYALSYHYGLDGLIDVANAVKNGATGKLTYAYGINKQLAQSISIFGTDTVTTIYTYNDNFQVIKSIQAYVGAVLTDSITVDYTYPDLLTRNPSSKVITHGGTLPDTTVYQYDTNINPFREFFPSLQAFNNVTRIEASGGTPVIIGYAYNELGYPVSATWSSGETQTFAYKCE